MAFRSSRRRFSVSASSSASRSARSRMIAGTAERPAARAARQRLSPAMSWNRSPEGRRSTGWTTPVERIDSVSSFSPSSGKTLRGCNGLGSINSTATESRPDVVVSTSRRSELSPRPNAFVCMGYNLLSELPIALGAARSRVVNEHRLAIAWRLGQTDIARDDGGEDLVAEKVLQIVPHLAGKVSALVVHRQQDAFDGEGEVLGAPE